MPRPQLHRIPSGEALQTAGLAPEVPFYAIGDVHGRYDLLAPLLDRLLATDDPVVLLGDYINKGPDSAAVLRLVRQATMTGQVIALRGNHEELLLRYLVRPRVLYDTFLGYDGLATLQSFGVGAPEPDGGLREMSRLRNALRARLGDLEDWIAGLPFHFQSGNVVALHAGCDPALPIDAQHPPSFAWGHPKFTKEPRGDGVWVVHGHTPVPAVSIKQKRIAIDTGAHQSGALSAVRIAPGRLSVL